MNEILFIDDDIFSMESTTDYCHVEFPTHHVKQITSIDEAMIHLKAKAESVDVIILDVMFAGIGISNMGGFNKGLEFYKTWLINYPYIPVIIFTNKPNTKEEVNLRNKDLVMYKTGSYDSEILFRKIKELINYRQNKHTHHETPL